MILGFSKIFREFPKYKMKKENICCSVDATPKMWKMSFPAIQEAVLAEIFLVFPPTGGGILRNSVEYELPTGWQPR